VSETTGKLPVQQNDNINISESTYPTVFLKTYIHTHIVV